MANFKKFGVAAAVAAALGASAAQAITLGEPGDALLIPHVVYDSAKSLNTLIGVIVTPYVGQNGTADISSIGDERGAPASQTPFPTIYTPRTAGPGCVRLGDVASQNNLPQLHWFFFNARSGKEVDGFVNVSCNDFVRIDWGHLVKSQASQLDGKSGYLVITDARTSESAGNPTVPTMIMHGATFLIQGNWQSQALIPTLPLRDVPDAQASLADEVKFNGSDFPGQVNPIQAGMALASDHVSPAQTASFSLRFFIDPALSGGTKFVVWLPDNGAEKVTDSAGVSTYNCPTGYRHPRCSLAVNYYDADEIKRSATTHLWDELNVLTPEELGISASLTADNPIDDLADPSAGKAVGTGFVVFSIADGYNTPPGDASSRAGVAFSLIDINGANGAQVQTELAHERGVIPRQ